jgi:hypothetical protein
MAAVIPMSVAEICDRWSIAKLRLERLHEEDPAELRRQVDHYAAGIDFDDPALAKLAYQLLESNAEQWDMEAAIRRGEMDDADLAEVGRLALRVRTQNRCRCRIKNEITKLVGSGFHEVRVNYAEGGV